MVKTAYLFPGQGAQFVGMGLDFYDHYPAARAVFDQAAMVLGPDIIEVIFRGPEEKLKQTEYTQPAILTVSVAIFRVLAGLGYRPTALAGLSLGEYSALVASGALAFEEALPLVRQRGIYMQDAVPPGAGGMVALMGLSADLVEQICREASRAGHVAPANYNCPGQLVISGHKAALDEAVALARAKGVKRVSPLKVSAPFHTALLDPVAEKMANHLAAVSLRRPDYPVVFNVTASFADDPDRIRKNLVRQVANPILWEQSVRTLLASGIEHVISIGPGNSLARLMKRIDPSVPAYSVEKVEMIDTLPAPSSP